MKELYVTAMLLLLVLMAACERRPLEEPGMVEVQVELDWSRSSVNPAEATVIFYDETGNSPRTLYVIGNKGKIKLPVGSYSVIAFNDKIGDFSEFDFRGTDHYNTIAIYATRMVKSYTNGMIDRDNGEGHDLLASDSRERFEVTWQMLSEKRSQPHLVMSPTDVVIATKVTVHIENMNLIHAGSQRCTLKGFAESVTLCNRQTSGATATYVVPLSYAEYYEGSQIHGFMSEQFTTFGLCPSEACAQPITFLFEALLRDKELTKFSYQKEITELVEVIVDPELKINIDIGIDPAASNPPIPIPPIIPIEDGAFRPGVSDWEEEEVIKPL